MNCQPPYRSLVGFLSLLQKPFGCLLLVAMFVSFIGCGPGPMGTYRLEKIGNEMVVIPPPYANVSSGKSIRFEFGSGNGKGLVRSKDCSAVSGPFKLFGTPSGWKATLPSLRTWRSETANGAFYRHFEDFLGQIDALATSGCILNSQAALFEQAVREAVPVAMRDTMLYTYGYSAGDGVINLEPGMRLVIQRAEYNQSGEFQGTETIYYKVTRDSKGRLRFRSVKSLHQGHARILPGDLDLGNRVGSDIRARLYFSGNLVPPNLNYSALVIGTRSLKHTEAIARELRAHPQNGCPPRSGKDAYCKPYLGMVTVVAELGVKVNGKKVFVAPGDNVRMALERAGRASCVNALRALRIERQFLGRPVRIAFDPTTESVLHLDLVADDRISCSTDNTTQGERKTGSDLREVNRRKASGEGRF
jgi:hypothetical protein